jgi:LAO/AO transport system kinase
VLTCSAISKEGITQIWEMVLEHRALLSSNGFLAQHRSHQALEWMNELTMMGLEELFQQDRAVSARLPYLREEVHGGRVTPFAASRELLSLFQHHPAHEDSRKET